MVLNDKKTSKRNGKQGCAVLGSQEVKFQISLGFEIQVQVGLSLTCARFAIRSLNTERLKLGRKISEQGRHIKLRRLKQKLTSQL
jgi:hypothetical protein